MMDCGTDQFLANLMQEQLLRDIEELIPVLRRYSRFLACDPHSADDVVQDCLELAVRDLDHFRAETNLRAWLLAMMRDCLVAGNRREKGGIEAGLKGAPCGEARSPARQKQDPLSEAFLNLPDSQKLAMICVIFEGLPYDEAAKVLEVPVGTIRSRVARGREALRRATAADPLRKSA